jgi:hypothetical protein
MNGTCVKRGPSDPYIGPVVNPVREPIQVINPPVTQTPEIIVLPPMVEVVPEVISVPVEVIDPLADKQLILDVIENKYDGCTIRELPRRNLNQLYVKMSFKGNFVTGREDNALAKALRVNIDKKICNLKI